MKLKKYFLLVFLILLSCLPAFAQVSKLSIKIKIENGKYIVSGAVSNETVKNEIVEKIINQLGNDIDFSQIKVDPTVKTFAADWQKNFDKSLSRLKNRRQGVFIFSTDSSEETYPLLPDEILNAEIVLTDDQRIKIKDFGDKTVVLFLVEAWCKPCVEQAKFLREINSAKLNNVEIIGVSFETGDDDRESFRRLGKVLKYKTGWSDLELRKALLKISKFDGVPQVFLIRNGKLHAIFVGGSPTVNQKMKELILQVSNAN